MTRKKLWMIIGGSVGALVIVGGVVFALTRSDSTESAIPDRR